MAKIRFLDTKYLQTHRYEYFLVFDNSTGGVVGVDDNLHPFFIWRTRSSREVVTGYLFGIIAMTSVCTYDTRGRAFLAEVDTLKGGTTSEGIVANVADGGRDVDLLEVGCTLEGTTGDAATVGMDGV